MFSIISKSQRDIHYCLTNELIKTGFKYNFKKRSQDGGTLEMFGSTADGPSVVVSSTADKASGASGPFGAG